MTAPTPTMTAPTPAPSYVRCHCGTRVEVDREDYGPGYGGRVRDACQPCIERTEEERYQSQWQDMAYGPGPAVFDGDF